MPFYLDDTNLAHKSCAPINYKKPERFDIHIKQAKITKDLTDQQFSIKFSNIRILQPHNCFPRKV